jgi:hypothetical protein
VGPLDISAAPTAFNLDFAPTELAEPLSKRGKLGLPLRISLGEWPQGPDTPVAIWLLRTGNDGTCCRSAN